MKEKSPAEILLGQVAEMIQLIQNHKGPISDNVTPRVKEEIERLESAIAIFEEANQKSFEEANINIESMRLDASRSTSLGEKDKQLLQRAREIERDAKNLQAANSQIIEKTKKNNAESKDTLKEQIKERRKRFKPLGGSKNWIPL
ncbi:MAG: hypothetical protein H0V82_08375 [Candidatus Protochlamydia sp.]|nr:hypothetical protein [Candidatus Protochlamydia sp.]